MAVPTTLILYRSISMSIYTSGEWKPRWYYILKNKITGKQYLGQTKQNIETYIGSGSYWINHCKKYGGHTRENIETIWCEFFDDESKAAAFLEEFEQLYPTYWSRDNLTEWANQTRENTSDCTFDTYKWDDAHRQAWLDNTYNNSEWRNTVGKEKAEKANAKLRDRTHLEEIGAIENWRRSRLEIVNDPIREQQRIDKFRESYYNTINDENWQKTVGESARKKKSAGSKKQRAKNKEARLRDCPICEQKIDCANLQRHIDKHRRQE